MKRLRVAIFADFPEEGWPSMDRVAAMLVENLRRHHAAAIDVTPVVPRFVRRAGVVGAGRAAFTLDRLLNRFWDYPRHAARLHDAYDVFHVVDHSYSQLVHRLPAGRTVVTCHDLDAFRSLLRPADEPRSRPFKAMSRRVLSGFQRAARITCDTAAVRDEVLREELVPADRLIVAPVGVGPEYSPRPDPDADREAARVIASSPGAVEVLHVGSTIDRKRVDLLLQICGELRQSVPNLHLVRVGGTFTPEQAHLARSVGLDGRISVLGFMDDRTLAAVYRRAALVLQPSDREGFGLPLIEAMACGTPVVASDLAVLREVGGLAIEYCPSGAAPIWCRRIVELLNERELAPERWTARREAAMDRASRFTWPQFAARVAQVYEEVAAADGKVKRQRGKGKSEV
jgi:glycosyltransferase involved in cell wall biosynthesis